ncbi:MAG: 2-oxo acid dehydrogenase subunit E2 [Clostridia bacterium]|nr:2-oxo acid dehydrogenase subunit E2 [Clostridia bacterium]
MESNKTEQIRSVPLTTMRRIISERMSASLTNTAQFTLTSEINVDALMEFIRQQKEAGKSVKFMHVLVKVVASLLKEHEMLNASIQDNKLVYHDYVNMGVAVALKAGLLVPVVKDVTALSLEEVGERYEALVPKARTGRIPVEDISGGTFTISNLGMAGIDAFTPIVNYPEAAILGVGRTTDRLDMDEQGNVYRKKVIVFSLTVDHRIVDGYVGAQFLAALAETLADMDKLAAAVS